MQKSGERISVASAVALGIGAMVGAGIFGLLGQAGAIAGSAVWLSFLLGGVVALASGYSLARLGSTYPSAGGVAEYLVRGYGEGLLSGALSVALYIAAVVSMSLVARTFGSYAATFFSESSRTVLVPSLSAAVVALFTAVNLMGAKGTARVENAIVVVKFLVLVAFSVVGFAYLSPENLAPSTYPPMRSVFESVAITFFAYEGFRVITNTAEDIDDPRVNLPRAMFIAIGLVAILYLIVSVSVFGNLPTERVIEARDYALAEAARPVFGQLGFTIMAVIALISTGSAINAGLYAVANVSYQMARHGELPGVFAQPIAHSREGLLVTGALVIALSLGLDLGEIAAVGSISVLLVHAAVHVGHLRVLQETGASRVAVIAALALTAGAAGLAMVHEMRSAPHVVIAIGGFLALAFAVEAAMRTFTQRTVRARRGLPAPDEGDSASGG